ncbi:short chain dehydrogenase [Pseudoruegeria aquimaris]|uniref:Short chain dehydrogenase n=1 Tax=Pseudoruegeria aquimaris TaxID=393663 RepID=A0A1Y5RFK3_9RHOB|nr:NAD-dependent epimerase/dehydratase family protein [Pseudoruegeria aquimaris]SLN16145.1 short chain dehydrogenase [Pseudoruegeria aquimaris]
MTARLIDTSAPVMVTGATGYVAGWIVKGLLEAGVTVHAAVRNPEDTEKTAHLSAIAATAPGHLKLFAADLLEEGSYASAMAGCAIVFHTASPFRMNVADPQADLVDPALKGTRNVLAEASRHGSVRRVVLTSSVVAIYGDNADIAQAPGGRIDETLWNTSSSLTRNPYAYSKTLAERAAWEMAEAQDQWDLVVINPSLVIGPALQARPTSESFNILRQMASGRMKAGAPRWGMGAVDVRDLAEAHLSAAYLPQAEGRNIVSAHETDFVEMAATLLPRYGDRYPLPRRALPKWLVWLVAPMARMTRETVARNVGLPFRADTSKAQAAFSLAMRPLAESMNDMFAQMIESGQIPAR